MGKKSAVLAVSNTLASAKYGEGRFNPSGWAARVWVAGSERDQAIVNVDVHAIVQDRNARAVLTRWVRRRMTVMTVAVALGVPAIVLGVPALVFGGLPEVIVGAVLGAVLTWPALVADFTRTNSVMRKLAQAPSCFGGRQARKERAAAWFVQAFREDSRPVAGSRPTQWDGDVFWVRDMWLSRLKERLEFTPGENLVIIDDEELAELLIRDSEVARRFDAVERQCVQHRLLLQDATEPDTQSWHAEKLAELTIQRRGVAEDLRQTQQALSVALATAKQSPVTAARAVTGQWARTWLQLATS